jgi:hypothetical protein
VRRAGRLADLRARMRARRRGACPRVSRPSHLCRHEGTVRPSARAPHGQANKQDMDACKQYGKISPAWRAGGGLPTCAHERATAAPARLPFFSVRGSSSRLGFCESKSTPCRPKLRKTERAVDRRPTTLPRCTLHAARSLQPKGALHDRDFRSSVILSRQNLDAFALLP